jgi:hypothetical protein
VCAIWTGLGRLLQNLFQMKSIELEELGEAAVGGLVGREGIALEPVIAAELVEVFTGIYRGVDQGWIEYAKFMRGLRRFGVRLAQGRFCGENGKKCKARKGECCEEAMHGETLADRSASLALQVTSTMMDGTRSI